MDRILYNTRLEKELIKEFKILAIKQEKRQNELLEEAIKDLLKKYEKKVKK
jgi:ribosomal protein L13